METQNPIEALLDRARSNNVTISAMCREAHVNEATVHRWKAGKNGANLAVLLRLDAALTKIIEGVGE